MTRNEERRVLQFGCLMVKTNGVSRHCQEGERGGFFINGIPEEQEIVLNKILESLSQVEKT